MNSKKKIFLTDLHHLDQKKIVLAIQSPRRIELLRSIGLNFDIVPSNMDEDINGKVDSIQFVRDIALKKAKLVWKKVNADLIIAADTKALKCR